MSYYDDDDEDDYPPRRDDYDETEANNEALLDFIFGAYEILCCGGVSDDD